MIRIKWDTSAATHGVWIGRTSKGHAVRMVQSSFGGRGFVCHVTPKGQPERPMVVSRETLSEAKRAAAAYIESQLV